ncbi:MAG TPA: acyltransferase family protein, partial [Rhizobacter sp.]
MAYRPDIDGLRAVAVLLVVVFHFHLFSAGKSGFIGVDVFFVISGFLITGLLAKEVAKTGDVSLLDFY